MAPFFRLYLLISVLPLTFLPLAAQQSSADRSGEPVRVATPQPAAPAEDDPHSRILGIIPNYRTYPLLKDYKPISAREKVSIATQDAFDRGSFVLSALFAAKGQLGNSDPSFGQGVTGYGHYFVTSFADWAIGDYMTEAVFPVMLHQDPRYFRRGEGSGISRLGYAVGQIFWTHTDSGGHMFNFSEIGGNAAGAAIAQVYYPDNRGAGPFASQLAVQVAMDMSSNIMKEFWPDVHRKLSRKHAPVAQAPTH